MTISITKSVDSSTNYDTLGVTIPNAESSVTLTYTVRDIFFFDGAMVKANFTVTVDGTISPDPFKFGFKYSGSGNPLDQAESSLSNYLEL